MWISRPLCLAWVLFLGISPALASAERWRDIHATPGFRHWRKELQRIADEDGHARRNHFCVVVRLWRGHDEPDNKAFVYWREDHTIQAYGQTRYNMGPLTQSGGDHVDLRHDVVASEKQINGSVSRVTRAYVDGIMRACRGVGTDVTITKYTKSRK